MLGPIHFHVLLNVRHDYTHAAHRLLDDVLGTRFLLPIPYANGDDTVAEGVRGHLSEEFEGHARERISQSYDQALVEKLLQPFEKKVGPRLDSCRIRIPLVARSDPCVMLGAQVCEKTSQQHARAILAAKPLPYNSSRVCAAFGRSPLPRWQQRRECFSKGGFRARTV